MKLIAYFSKLINLDNKLIKFGNKYLIVKLLIVKYKY